MGLDWLNDFIKTYLPILKQKGIITQGYKTAPNIILDYSGFMLQKLMWYMKSADCPTFDDVYQLAKQTLMKFCVDAGQPCPGAPRGTLRQYYIVFDTWTEDPNSPITQMKMKEREERKKNVAEQSGLRVSEYLTIINLLFPFLWQDQDFNDCVYFVLAKHEADVMCGSLQKFLGGPSGNDAIIYSIDADLVVYSYPNPCVNIQKGHTIYTKPLFDLFGCNDPAKLCAFLGCDYLKPQKQNMVVDSVVHSDQFVATTPLQRNIYSIFSKYRYWENDFNKPTDTYIELCIPKLNELHQQIQDILQPLSIDVPPDLQEIFNAIDAGEFVLVPELPGVAEAFLENDDLMVVAPEPADDAFVQLLLQQL